MVKGPSFIIRHVPDMGKARAFYTDVLGLQVEEENPGFVQFANTGGATFALSPADAGDAIEAWWFVDDVDASHEDARKKGVEVVHPPKDEPFGRSLVIKDAAGGNVYLLQLPQ